ncbi:cyclin N-terminal domain-containing protein [Favolaschia claudopus]|uniref:Cyclin N-terminal domain-containing protein n=1 Tax=Favolaschia claudopus TaxID=2862362 RepID=A0AAW0DMW8_9AGAR
MDSPASSSSSGSPASYSSWSPSSSSSHSSPVHPASLVDPALHSPELMQLVDIDLSRPVINYVARSVIETVNHAFDRPSTFRSPASYKFPSFVSSIISRAEITPATLLVALVYITRSRRHLSIALEEWALERVFLGALIVASKYTQDSTLRNVHWAMVTRVFGQGDIGRIEREFLEVLNWELSVTEADVLAHQELLDNTLPLMPATRKSVDEIEVRKSAQVPVPVVPDLEPSSPHSSVGSASPRTPISPSPAIPIDVDMEEAKSPTVYEPSPLPASSPSPSPPYAPLPVAEPTQPAKKRRCPHAHKPSSRPSGAKRFRDFLHVFQPHSHMLLHHAVDVAA